MQDLIAPMPLEGEGDSRLHDHPLVFEHHDPGGGCRWLSDLILSTDNIARHIEIYHARTGEVPSLVHSVCVREGWLKRYVSVPGTCGPTVVVGDDYELKTETVRGPWRIRFIGRKSPKRKAGLPGLPLLSLAAETQPHPA